MGLHETILNRMLVSANSRSLNVRIMKGPAMYLEKRVKIRKLLLVRGTWEWRESLEGVLKGNLQKCAVSARSS